jgi:hypothetical protein
MSTDGTDVEACGRRRLAAGLGSVALALLVIAALFADGNSAVGAVGVVAPAQGMGLAVALVWLAASHNALSRR